MTPSTPHPIENTFSLKWLSEKVVAELTGLSVSTLQKHRFKGRGIPYSKIGRAVRYAMADVVTYMEEHKICPTL